jgi:hypothetical protein
MFKIKHIFVLIYFMKGTFYKDYEYYTLRLRLDGIMHLHLKKGDYFTMTTYKQMLVKIDLLLNHRKAPFLISLEPFETLNHEICNFVATEEGAPYSTADAIIADNLGFKLIANFYIRVKKPLRPTRIFISEPDAINWLKKII